MSKEFNNMGVRTEFCPEKDEIDVSVIVVTYNSADCIQKCLQSVIKQREVNFEIIVVDNVSSDNTVKAIQETQRKVRLQINHENVGFGRACNQGAALSSGKYIMFLNPDAAFNDNGILSKLCRVMERNISWGLAGTTVTEADGSVDCPPSYTYPKQDRASRDFSVLPGRIAWVFGASMIVRREAFEKAGGFDPEFFLTSEETDLCLRLREGGYEIGFVSEVEVRHIGAASERGRDPYETWRLRVPGIYRFWAKHYPQKDARKLVKRDWLRARYRQTVYQVPAFLGGNESVFWQKYRRYMGIGDAASAFLRSLDEKPEVVPTAFPKTSSGSCSR